jgi:hypothetical protein
LQYDDADIVTRSSDGIDFCVHRLIISLASVDLLDQVSSGQDSLPVLKIPEDSRTLARLLELCYPVDGTDWESLNSTLAILQAAAKYQMKKVIWLRVRYYR